MGNDCYDTTNILFERTKDVDTMTRRDDAPLTYIHTLPLTQNTMGLIHSSDRPIASLLCDRRRGRYLYNDGKNLAIIFGRLLFNLLFARCCSGRITIVRVGTNTRHTVPKPHRGLFSPVAHCLWAFWTRYNMS